MALNLSGRLRNLNNPKISIEALLLSYVNMINSPPLDKAETIKESDHFNITKNQKTTQTSSHNP